MIYRVGHMNILGKWWKTDIILALLLICGGSLILFIITTILKIIGKVIAWAWGWS